MKITISTTPAELQEMGLPTAQALSSAILDRLDQEGIDHEGRRVDLAGFDVSAAVADPGCELNWDATDLDSLITFALALRAQQGNMPIKHHPVGSGGQLVPVSISVSRLGASGQPRLVSRGGSPVLVLG